MSCGEVDDSIRKWAKGKVSVENEENLVFLSFGARVKTRQSSGSHLHTDFLCADVTHILRPEDFPARLT